MLGRVPIDLTGPQPVAVKDKSCIMLFRDGFNRKSWVYF